MYIKSVFCFIVALVAVSSCSKDHLSEDEMADKAGNVYKTVTIGNQVWMASNLRAQYTNYENTSYINPDLQPADFIFPDFDPSTMDQYGLLYSYNGAVSLLPGDGWRIPTKQDIEYLLSVLSGQSHTDEKAIRLKQSLKIDDYPGANTENTSIDKYFSMWLNDYSTNIDYDYLNVRLFARDYPDNELYEKDVYYYNVIKSDYYTVRYVKDLE